MFFVFKRIHHAIVRALCFYVQQGHTALDVARQYGKADVIRLLTVRTLVFYT